MPKITELVDELSRLKPGSPALHTVSDVAEGVDWWNSLSADARVFWLGQVRDARLGVTVAEAWAEYKRQMVFQRLSTNVVALLNR